MSVVARGEVRLGARPDQPVLSENDIRERAFRTCPLGSVACGFRGIELRVADGVAGVNVLCDTQTCGNNDQSLQGGLDRLAIQRGVSTAKSQLQQSS
jgi:hypothetical protein